MYYTPIEIQVIKKCQKYVFLAQMEAFLWVYCGAESGENPSVRSGHHKSSYVSKPGIKPKPATVKGQSANLSAGRTA